MNKSTVFLGRFFETDRSALISYQVLEKNCSTWISRVTNSYVRFVIQLVVLPMVLFSLVSCDQKSPKYMDDSEVSQFLSDHYFTVPEKALSLKNFEYEVFYGNKENLDSNRGKIILLNFWATWCFPCRKEMPDLEELNHLMKGEKFRIIAIGVGENEERVNQFLKKYPYSFDIALDQEQKITKSLEIAGLPTTFVMDGDGRVLGKMIGPVDWKKAPMVEFFRTISRK